MIIVTLLGAGGWGLGAGGRGLCIEVHKATMKLPAFEKYEQGCQIRRSSKSIKDNIAEGYGRRKDKNEYLNYLIYAQASCDETLNHL